MVKNLIVEKTYDFIALGNTLMDFLVEIEDCQLSATDLKKGEFHLVEEKKAQELLQKIKEAKLNIETVPGGSAANTLKGLAFLGGKAILCGKVGDDEYGQRYIQEMDSLGIISRIKTGSSTTGHALTFITPDTERTFSVYLGAALQLAKEDILEEDIQKSKILHLEGYQLEGPTREAVLHALTLAKTHNTLVSLDLADPGLIRRNKKFLRELIANHINIVFLNELEAKEFTGLPPELAVQEIARSAQIAVVKLGKEGSLICQDGLLTFIPSFPAQAIDTTGAGDTYAAGFLYGYLQGWPLEKAGKLGSLMAAKIVEQKGVKIHSLNLNELKETLNNDNT